jgi:hypothetical protein
VCGDKLRIRGFPPKPNHGSMSPASTARNDSYVLTPAVKA